MEVAFTTGQRHTPTSPLPLPRIRSFRPSLSQSARQADALVPTLSSEPLAWIMDSLPKNGTVTRFITALIISISNRGAGVVRERVCRIGWRVESEGEEGLAMVWERWEFPLVWQPLLTASIG